MSQVSSFRKDTVDEPCDPSPECVRPRAKLRFRVEISQLNCQLDLTVELTHRTHRNVQEAAHLSGRVPASPFSDMGADGDCRGPHLRGKAVPLSTRKHRSSFVNRPGQGDTLMPHIETSKITHLCLRNARELVVQPSRIRLPRSGRLETCHLRPETGAVTSLRIGLRLETCDLGQQR